jgi:hypothetical protein
MGQDCEQPTVRHDDAVRCLIAIEELNCCCQQPLSDKISRHTSGACDSYWHFLASSTGHHAQKIVGLYAGFLKIRSGNHESLQCDTAGF